MRIINSVITISLTSNCRSASFHDECLTFMFLLMALVPDNFLAGPSFTLKHYNALTKKKTLSTGVNKVLHYEI